MVEQTTLAVGQELRSITHKVGLPEMVLYASATWDWHRLHYDPEYAQGLGFDRPVVDGQIIGAFFATQIGKGFGATAVIRKLAFRFRSMIFAGDTVVCYAHITGIEDCRAGVVVVLELEARVAEQVAVGPASAEVLIRTT